MSRLPQMENCPVSLASGRFLRLGGALLLGAAFAACGSDTTEPDPVTVAAPTNVAAASLSTTSIQVTWSQVSNATSYEVDRSSGAGGSFTTVGTGLTSTAYTDAGLSPSTQYTYQVRAVNGSIKSSNSSSASATTGTVGPKTATITGVTLSRTLYADSSYTLSVFVKVSNGATLTIQAGTTIIGDTL
ncbi:MAG: fibronectin type III domain-containing protein, partial [Gemmatimonadales bacterium]